jgi:hypothetical protein
MHIATVSSKTTGGSGAEGGAKGEERDLGGVWRKLNQGRRVTWERMHPGMGHKPQRCLSEGCYWTWLMKLSLIRVPGDHCGERGFGVAHLGVIMT